MIQGESPGRRVRTLPPPREQWASLDAHDDEALLARLRAGDEVAFRALVDRHRPWLVRLCTRLLGHDTHAAEDAAQETLLKLHAAARRDGRPLRVRAWLTVVARNTCVDEQRRRRPDLPGDLPERPAPGHDPFALDPALADAWARLAGRHREVLYLREVLGFSYKEIGAVMGLTMPATETLVFRARAALRREYERSGGSAFGCGLLGWHLARLGLGRRRDRGVADGVPGAAMSDPGLTGLGTRVAQWMSTALPGGGEQAVAKVLSLAAGVVVAAASVIPGLGPFAGAPPAAAAITPAAVSGQSSPNTAFSAVTTAASIAASEAMAPATRAVSLKAMLGNSVPADWSPRRRGAEATPTSSEPAVDRNVMLPRPATPLRDAAAARPADGPALNRPVQDEVGAPKLRSVLPSPEGPVNPPERPTHPLRALLADPTPLPIDLPADPLPTQPLPLSPADPNPAIAEPTPESQPSTEETVGPAQDVVTTFAGNEPALVRRRNG